MLTPRTWRSSSKLGPAEASGLLFLTHFSQELLFSPALLETLPQKRDSSKQGCELHTCVGVAW